MQTHCFFLALACKAKCIEIASFFFFCQIFPNVGNINKNVLGWFLLIMCNDDTLTRSSNLISRNHITLSFWLKREGWPTSYYQAVTFFKLILGSDCWKLCFWRVDFKKHPDSVILQKNASRFQASVLNTIRSICSL